MKLSDSSTLWTSFIRMDIHGEMLLSRHRLIQTSYGSSPASNSRLQFWGQRSMGLFSGDRIPDRVAHFAAITGPHRIGIEKQVRDGRPGILIDEGVQPFQRHVRGLSRAEESGCCPR